MKINKFLIPLILLTEFCNTMEQEFIKNEEEDKQLNQQILPSDINLLIKFLHIKLLTLQILRRCHNKFEQDSKGNLTINTKK